MRSLKTAGLAAAWSVGAVVVVAVAQSLAHWPPTTGDVVVGEWYSDIPWHQKLGTYAGNQIDAQLFLPYEAMGATETKFCTDHNMSQEDCMLELGVNNILGMYRTDSPYKDLKAPQAPECKPGTQDCIQVTLDLGSYSTKAVGSEIKLLPRSFGTEPQHGYRNYEYGGYVITDGSIYAPQMPWYMSHYCDAFVPQNPAVKDVQDPVCYADYFSPMNNGFSALKGKTAGDWPRTMPWQPAIANNVTQNHCAGGADLTKCTLALGGFDLKPLSPTLAGIQYKQYNENLVTWFNNALRDFADAKNLELNKHKFPWAGTQGAGTATQVDWPGFLYQRARLNPFLGQFDNYETEAAVPAGCDVFVSGPNNPDCIQTTQMRSTQYYYPRQCKLDDLAGGAPTEDSVAKLRQCGLNYELHHNGFLEQWPRGDNNAIWDKVIDSGIAANQYGRTSFLFAGVPGMQMPVSFFKDSRSDSGLSNFEQVHNASIFSLFLPMANVADDNPKNTYFNRYYKDQEWYHVLLMANHMEDEPEHFLDGIRGKALWHNEYRTQGTYLASMRGLNPDRWFAAAFKTTEATTPYHNNTCDGCHVRNGSGIPINTENKLAKLQGEFMKTEEDYNPYVPTKDYTFTGQIRPMKLVFFDLKRDTARLDASRYSEPLSFSAQQIQEGGRTMPLDSFYYGNKIMNFYGDSFHVTTPGYGYKWAYADAHPSRLVVGAARRNAEIDKTYAPQQIALSNFTVGACDLVKLAPTTKPWPTSCPEVDGEAILKAINADREVGFMLLNGKRLGNLSAIEAIPSNWIVQFQKGQATLLGAKIAGEIVWNAGARDGIDRPESKIFRLCRTKSAVDCFIARFGYLGDRVSLEDQVANAAFVEMNMTSSEGYKRLYFKDVPFPIRYLVPNCGPANKTCIDGKANKDLTERDIDRMADYARWVGNPTRSEFKVSMQEVVDGERVFKQLKCDTCHAIQKIKIDPEDTMLTKNYRERLKKHVSASNDPFLSYIGTDLLMHDMGYLSQVGVATQSIRDADGVVLDQFKNYVQKIRTPPLKGLRFNRFVTESHRNTKTANSPACDFLLHDGRACDAVEAAFLHDGPAIKKLNVIDGLNKLTPEQVMQLRAFLYSL